MITIMVMGVGWPHEDDHRYGDEGHKEAERHTGGAGGEVGIGAGHETLFTSSFHVVVRHVHDAVYITAAGGWDMLKTVITGSFHLIRGVCGAVCITTVDGRVGARSRLDMLRTSKVLIQDAGDSGHIMPAGGVGARAGTLLSSSCHPFARGVWVRLFRTFVLPESVWNRPTDLTQLEKGFLRAGLLSRLQLRNLTSCIAARSKRKVSAVSVITQLFFAFGKYLELSAFSKAVNTIPALLWWGKVLCDWEMLSPPNLLFRRSEAALVNSATFTTIFWTRSTPHTRGCETGWNKRRQVIVHACYYFVESESVKHEAGGI